MDPVVPPQTAVAYYEGVVKTMGGLAPTQDFSRLFMAPGMGHCAGGPGPNQFDAIGALEQWVEKGVAPDSADCHPQHRRQGRALAPAVRLSEGGALQGHGQHRRGRQLHLRSRACASLTSSSVKAAAR